MRLQVVKKRLRYDIGVEVGLEIIVSVNWCCVALGCRFVEMYTTHCHDLAFELDIGLWVIDRSDRKACFLDSHSCDFRGTYKSEGDRAIVPHKCKEVVAFDEHARTC